METLLVPSRLLGLTFPWMCDEAQDNIGVSLWVGIPCLGRLGCGRQEAGSVGYFSSSSHAGDPLLNQGGMISTLGGSDAYEEAEPQKSHFESDPRWDMTSPECSQGLCCGAEVGVAWVSVRRQETRARCSSYHFPMRGGSWGPDALE